MADLILAVDQGTTGTTVLVVTPDGRPLGSGYHEHPQHFPQPGWVEHDAEAIWQTVLESTVAALADAAVTAGDIAAVGITNQRETIVAWDARDSRPLGPTIVWQDRRTSDDCAALRAAGVDTRIREVTGLPTDPYFSATKVAWLLRHDDAVRAAADNGHLRLGTIDSWLAWRMSAGATHLTDATNAARTMLYDIHSGSWSAELCEQFGVDAASWLPRVVDSSGQLSECVPEHFCGISAPLCGIAGDQQSALFGQACFTRGQAKATYGTGAFVLVNNGGEAPVSDSLISTIAWAVAGDVTYALEGAVFTAGASVQWLRDGLQVIETSPEVEALARSVPDSGGAVLVPAFAGLGAPMWHAEARAALLGMTRGTTRAHVARATLEAVAFRTAQLVDAMRAEGTVVRELRVDGGMAANDLLLQMQADVLGIPVRRPANIETTSLGAALLAAHGSGLLPSLAEVEAAWHAERTFEPGPQAAALQDGYRRFEHAVDAVRAFADATAVPTAAPGAASAAAAAPAAPTTAAPTTA